MEEKGAENKEIENKYEIKKKSIKPKVGSLKGLIKLINPQRD